MNSTTLLILSLVLELFFEVVVDIYALDVEMKEGVDLELFWTM